MSSKFGQMRPLVSMATDRVTVGKTASSCFLERFRFDSFHTPWIRPWTTELAAPERLKKIP